MEEGLDRMAGALALSPGSLHRRVHQEANLSPAQLLTRVRMDGQRTQLHRAFSQQLSVLPSEYRERFG